MKKGIITKVLTFILISMLIVGGQPLPVQNSYVDATTENFLSADFTSLTAPSTAWQSSVYAYDRMVVCPDIGGYCVLESTMSPARA